MKTKKIILTYIVWFLLLWAVMAYIFSCKPKIKEEKSFKKTETIDTQSFEVVNGEVIYFNDSTIYEINYLD